jgi:hypothetical protein
LTNTEDELQLSVYDLQNIAKYFNVQTSTKKTKIMAFEGKYPIRRKIFMYNKITENVSCFKYLEPCVTYENKKNIAEKITDFNRKVGITD